VEGVEVLDWVRLRRRVVRPWGHGRARALGDEAVVGSRPVRRDMVFSFRALRLVFQSILCIRNHWLPFWRLSMEVWIVNRC
jgi:hypothetical protein